MIPFALDGALRFLPSSPSRQNQTSAITYEDLNNGEFHKILTSSTAQTLLGHYIDDAATLPPANAVDLEDSLTDRIVSFLDVFHSNLPARRNEIFLVGCAALHAFLQSNVTGPPLSWSSATIIFSEKFGEQLAPGAALHAQMVARLTVDGEAVYKLTPHVELFCLAKLLLNYQVSEDDRIVQQLRFRVRVNFWHQRLLGDISPTLQDIIYRDLRLLEEKLPVDDRQARAEFLVQRATIHIHHGHDAKARDDLAEAGSLQRFEYALTGRLGKRTKFQEKELSQLVILARSADNASSNVLGGKSHAEKPSDSQDTAETSDSSKPLNLQLKDDTLLESISFKQDPDDQYGSGEEDLPETLRDLDPANQPVLDPLDSIILLATASSITNTSPQDGLTREETLPYASRVLAGASTNWQIYTQALIVRSRIEGYRSRTTERGLLQLQAIVDQVIAETTSDSSLKPIDTDQQQAETHATTFLPQPKLSESAPISQRLRYIHLLASPTRWKLESELADRWISLGGLRSALEIYERLQMWAEVALCWAAQDREDKARKIIRQQLYVSSSTGTREEANSVDEETTSTDESTIECDPLPNDAPRLFCILGDIEKSVAAYERAWEVSNRRYARAQRSLGKYYFAVKELKKADEAYSRSLKINPQNHSVWFALGCVRLQLEDWTGAVDAFARAVQIEEKDAESWSNLAAALLRLTPERGLEESDGTGEAETAISGENLASQKTTKIGPQKHIQEAFVALKRAASLKRDSYRIWQNLLHVSVQLSPPPYTDIIIAQTRLIDLLSKSQGENCIDIPVVEGLLAHLIATSPSTTNNAPTNNENPAEPTAKRSGFEKMLVDLVQKRITPLITSSRRLWLLTAKLSLHLQRPSAALAAYEKAWRVTMNQPGWESGTTETEKLWLEVAEATGELVDAYESLGERRREGGLGEGEMVARDWRFKARSAVRGVIGRAKEGWEGSEELERLRGRMGELKSG